MTPTRPRIYIAGPYTGDTRDQVESNVSAAIDAGISLIRRGWAPFIPHLSHHIEIRLKSSPLEYEAYIEIDRSWLEASQAFLYLRPSPGADRELQVARALSLPIFDFIDRVPDADEFALASDHPSHYGGADDPFEAIKVIEAWDLGFNLGNAVKYIRRAGRKPGASAVEDLQKARFYINRAIER